METDNKNTITSKKVLIIILIIIAVYIAFTIPYRIIKANKLYGDEKCSLVTNPSKDGFDIIEHSSGPQFYSKTKCEVCGWGVVFGTGGSKLCDMCAFITGRCETCGKLLK